MQVKGAATQLATGATKFDGSGAVWVFNTASSAAVVTIRNAADDADAGTIYIGGGAGMVIHLQIGQGLRGATTFYGTEITNSGY